MKILRVLGILWLLLCVYFTITLFGALRVVFAPANHGFFVKNLLINILLRLPYLLGVPASIFVIRGATRARVVLGIVAVLVICSCFAFIPLVGFIPIGEVVIGGFALISAIVLLLPRRYLVA